MRWLILLLLASPAVAEELPFTVSTMGSGSGPEAAQLAGPTGALQRGAEHGGKGLACQHRCQQSCFLLTLRKQGKIGAAGMPSVLGPFRSAMAQQPKLTMFGHRSLVTT